MPESFRQTISACIPLLVVIILFAIVGKFGVTKVIEIRSKVTAAENTTATLTQKLNLLQTISSTVSLGAPLANSALPALNPSLAVSSQLKTLALQDGVLVSSVKSNAGGVSLSGLHEADLSFIADGTRQQVFKLIEDMATIAPVTVINEIRVSENAGALRAGVSAKSYWADLPKTIPAIDAPITDLSQDEKETLGKINALLQPQFTQITASQSGGTNLSPFGE
jgi:hypothetical protein